jgi:hypothetical protein
VVWGEISLKLPEHHLLAAVADRCDESGEFWGSPEYFAHRSGICKRSVQNYKKRWLESGAIMVVGKYFYGARKKVRCNPEEAVGRGSTPLYRLDLSVFPRKKQWAEIRGTYIERQANDDEQFLRPPEPMHPYGKREPEPDEKGCTPEQEKGANQNTERVQISAEKGASGDRKGCISEQERVQIDPTHNKADTFVDSFVYTLEGGPLPDPSSAAHWLLTEINQKNIATVAPAGSMRIAASAIETWKRQEPERTFTEIAERALESAVIYGRSPGRNWYAFFANGLCKSLREGTDEKHQGNGIRSKGGAFRSGEKGKYDDPPDYSFAV